MSRNNNEISKKEEEIKLSTGLIVVYMVLHKILTFQVFLNCRDQIKRPKRRNCNVKPI